MSEVKKSYVNDSSELTEDEAYETNELDKTNDSSIYYSLDEDSNQLNTFQTMNQSLKRPNHVDNNEVRENKKPKLFDETFSIKQDNLIMSKNDPIKLSCFECSECKKTFSKLEFDFMTK